MVAAIASGNCVIVKPSEGSPSTSKFIKELIKCSLDFRFYRCIEGNIQTSIRLTSTAFDYIVFTGGTSTGKLVAKAASDTLTPCI